jgi:hypothetical protein
MSKKYTIISVLVLVLYFNDSFCQQKTLPGGVTNPYYWLQSKNNKDIFFWKNSTANTLKELDVKRKGTLFNFNPSIIFDGSKDVLDLSLNQESTKKQTFFIVYNVDDSNKEEFLWNLSNSKKTIAVATNKRLADIKSYSYQTFKEKIKPQKANIHFYQHNKSDIKENDFSLLIGSKPNGENLPPSVFKGNISEILLFDRVLSTPENQRISSYLAMKYGVSLSQLDMKNYVNSKGEIIWEAEKHKGFDNAITAIGRDDTSGLLQPKSSNMQDEGLLSMEIKTKSNVTIPDNYFVFWSDNGKDLAVKKQKEGEPIGISRQWQLDFAKKENIGLEWVFDPNFIKTVTPGENYYWLQVDYSGKGTFEEGKSEYVRLEKTTSKEKMTLSDFDWDKQKSGKVAFTIQVAPEMFSKAWITPPTCGVAGSGELHYTIEGGSPPFTVSVKESGTAKIAKQWSQTAKNSTTGTQLTSGSYEYTIRDSKGNIYNETIFVADKDGTYSNLKSNYLLEPEKPLVLDASAGLTSGQNQYEWYFENKLIDTNASISVVQAGEYELRIFNAQQCKTSSKIVVEAKEISSSDGSTIVLFPNPTTDGRFTVSMRFPNKTNATLSIHTETGALIKQTKLSQIDGYNYQDSLLTSGFYFITISSEFETKTFKIIVK